MEFPGDLKYTKEHEWVRIEGDSAVMGITEFAQSELGDIVFVELPAVGASFEQGDTACVVESTKAASDVYSPVAGEVQEVNEQLSDQPELVNTDPFGEGWLCKLGSIQAADLENLMSADQYKEFVENS